MRGGLFERHPKVAPYDSCIACFKGDTPEQLEAVIATAEEKVPSYAMLIVILAYTGLCVREALALRWADVDFDSATLHVRCQLGVDDRTIIPKPKTDAGVRDLPILRHCAAACSPTGSPRSGSGRATSSAQRQRARRRATVRRALKAVARNSGSTSPRTTSAAHWLVLDCRRPRRPGRVTGVMGHANIETTRRIYAADWRQAEERNAIVLRQLARAEIGH